LIREALDGLLVNIRFENEKVNVGYVKALLPETTVQ